MAPSAAEGWGVSRSASSGPASMNRRATMATAQQIAPEVVRCAASGTDNPAAAEPSKPPVTAPTLHRPWKALTIERPYARCTRKPCAFWPTSITASRAPMTSMVPASANHPPHSGTTATAAEPNEAERRDGLRPEPLDQGRCEQPRQECAGGHRCDRAAEPTVAQVQSILDLGPDAARGSAKRTPLMKNTADTAVRALRRRASSRGDTHPHTLPGAISQHQDVGKLVSSRRTAATLQAGQPLPPPAEGVLHRQLCPVAHDLPADLSAVCRSSRHGDHHWPGSCPAEESVRPNWPTVVADFEHLWVHPGWIEKQVRARQQALRRDAHRALAALPAYLGIAAHAHRMWSLRQMTRTLRPAQRQPRPPTRGGSCPSAESARSAAAGLAPRQMSVPHLGVGSLRRPQPACSSASAITRARRLRRGQAGDVKVNELRPTPGGSGSMT